MKTIPEVDDYIRALPQWQQDICVEVRELIHKADAAFVALIKAVAENNRHGGWRKLKGL